MIDVVGKHGTYDAQVVDTSGHMGKQIADVGAGLPVFFEGERRLQQVAVRRMHQLGLFKGDRLAV